MPSTVRGCADTAAANGRHSLTRGEQLAWWRRGFEAGQADRHDRGQADHVNACAEFPVQRAADQQAVIGALLLDVVDALASAMAGR
jgi:hypothetical protein